LFAFAFKFPRSTLYVHEVQKSIK